MSSAAGHALAVPCRFVDREARASADRALNTASDLVAALLLTREVALASDTPGNAADLADRIGDVISHLVVAQSRYRARAGAV